MKRIILAGVLGAVAMFVWMSLAHMVLPLGMVGIKEMPNEQQVMQAMTATMGTEHGMYLYPGLGLKPNATREDVNAAMKGYEAKLASNPSGILIYNPPGAKGMEPRQLVVEFLTELIVCLIVVWLLAQTQLRSFGGRVAFVAMAGLMVSMMTNVQYWNWYRFPGSYTLASMFTQFVGFIVLGLVAAWVLRKSAPMGFTAKA